MHMKFGDVDETMEDHCMASCFKDFTYKLKLD